ncbi:MAG: hypothetical protein K0S07_183 [Chlamydiales bacterium]|jgi:hypothetical protein|nr:hypothetical protein [Chlamydiales bacterium]
MVKGIEAKFIDHVAAYKLDLSHETPLFKKGKDVSRIAIKGFSEQLQIAAKKEVNSIEEKFLFRPLEVKIGDDFQEIYVNINSLAQRTGISKARIKEAKTGTALAQLIEDDVLKKTTKQYAVQAILNLHQQKELSTQEKKMIPLLIGSIGKYTSSLNEGLNEQVMQYRWNSVWSIAAAFAPIQLFKTPSLKWPTDPENVKEMLKAAAHFERPEVIHLFVQKFEDSSEKKVIQNIERLVNNQAEAHHIHSIYSKWLKALELHNSELPAEVKDHIFSFLETKDIPPVAAVNSFWKEQIGNSSLMKRARSLAPELLFKKAGGVIDYDPELIEQSLQAIDEVKIRQPAILKALGGLLHVQQLPILNLKGQKGQFGYIDFIEPEMMSAPVMRGIDIDQRPFIAFKYVINEGDEMAEYVETLFQRYSDEPLIWVSGRKYSDRLFENMDQLRESNQDLYLGRVERLLKGEELPFLKFSPGGVIQEKQGSRQKIRLSFS